MVVFISGNAVGRALLCSVQVVMVSTFLEVLSVQFLLYYIYIFVLFITQSITIERK